MKHRVGYIVELINMLEQQLPTYASSKDIQTLKDYGVKVVVDLRSDFEKECQPNPFANDKDIDYYEVNLFDSSKAVLVPDEVKTYKDLGGVYIYMLEGMNINLRNCLIFL